MGGFLALITSIKEALALVNEIISGAKALAQFIQDNKDEAWFQASAEAFKEIRNAKTPIERKEAARKLRDSWRNL